MKPFIYQSEFETDCKKLLNQFMNHPDILDCDEEFINQLKNGLMKIYAKKKKSVLLQDISISTINSKGIKKIKFYNQITKQDTALIIRFDEIIITDSDFEFKADELIFQYVLPIDLTNGEICKPRWTKIELNGLSNSESWKITFERFIEFIKNGGYIVIYIAKFIKTLSNT